MAYRNAPLHPVLRLIYLLLRLLSWAGVYVFYRRRLVLGREHLRFDGPAIVVSNHPSTLMDPLNAGIHIRQEMFFLANYSLFKNPLSGWVLRRLFCIPVKRKEDVAAGESRDNDAAFEASFQHLEKGGVLFVAAEGVSWMNRFVRPFKTGTARIAFGAERRNDWKLGVKIIPVGLSYEAPNLFRSRMAVEFGAPVSTNNWAEAEARDHEKAVDDFTAEIENTVRALTLDSGSEAGDIFLNQLEALIRSAHPQLSATDEYFFLKNCIAKNRHNEALKNRLAAHFAMLEKAGLSAAALSRASRPAWLHFLVLLLGWPIFLLGYGFWFLPCYLPWFLAKRLGLYVGYDSNVKMLAGLFTFPLALRGAWALAFALSNSSAWAWISIAGLGAAGYFAEWYADVFRRWQERRAAQHFQQQSPSEWARLGAEHSAIADGVFA